MVDAAGDPVEGVPVYDGAETGMFAGSLPLGRSNEEGVFIPAAFPVAIHFGSWPATPEELTLTDDRGEHVVTVVDACDVARSSSWTTRLTPRPVTHI